MRTYLSNSSALYKAGISPGFKVFKILSGQYTGRILILMQTSSSEIKKTWADYPYTDWSTPEVIINDCADYTFDAVMQSSGDVIIAYTLGANDDLVARKLTFASGDWSAGSLNTVYNGDDNYFPSLVRENTGKLWISWSRLSGGLYTINAKSSDDGITWGSGAGDAGTTLTSGAAQAFSKCIIMGSYLYCLYVLGETKLSYRRKYQDSSSWDSELDIAVGSGFDHNFNAAISDDNRFGVVYNSSGIRYREFNGDVWSGIETVDADGGTFPQIKYFANNPYLTYLSEYGSSQNKIYYSRRLSGSFSTPALLDPRRAELDSVVCYENSSGTYEDLSTASSNNSTGDVFHTGSSAMLSTIDDVVYFGHNCRFNYLKIILSSAGAAGAVLWQYYNGADWVSFTPSGGAFNFDSLDTELLLWNDYGTIPGDWQACSVNGSNCYWIRAIVSSAFSSGPVGTQITAISDAEAVVLME